jgi:hypothetical protein
MEHKVIEGTWEEVTRRGQELAGHLVRVIVLDDLTVPTAQNGDRTGETAEPTAFDVMSRAGLIGCLKGGGSTDLATNPAHMEGFGE